jgi:dTDP-4-dehydrorhamnose reductase
MILLLGASGYLGQAFASELHRRGCNCVPLTRRAINYADFDLLFNYVRRTRPEFLINAAGCIGKPGAGDCEHAREEALAANTLLPQTIARVCLITHTPWGHVSSGGIYTGARVLDHGIPRIERDLNRPEMRRLLAEHPETVTGFTELDQPNFSFRHLPCNFYCGTKALAEEAIQGIGQSYIWRPGILINERVESRNFLWRLLQFQKVHDRVIAISHLDDFVRASLNLWERQAPYGIYNVVNPGVITTRQIVGMIQHILIPAHRFEFWRDDAEFNRLGPQTPWSSCLLDVSKLLGTGVALRPATDAIEDSLRHWRPAVPAAEPGSY